MTHKSNSHIPIIESLSDSSTDMNPEYYNPFVEVHGETKRMLINKKNKRKLKTIHCFQREK